MLRGVDPLPSFGVLCDGDVGFDPGACEALCKLFFSANRFSKVPRSVRPLSSSLRSPKAGLAMTSKKRGLRVSKTNCANSPDNLSKLSILPSLFSSPSIYFALARGQRCSVYSSAAILHTL